MVPRIGRFFRTGQGSPKRQTRRAEREAYDDTRLVTTQAACGAAAHCAEASCLSPTRGTTRPALLREDRCRVGARAFRTTPAPHGERRTRIACNPDGQASLSLRLETFVSRL